MYEVRFLNEKGLEESVQFVDISAVQRFYMNLPLKYTTLSFKSLESDRTVE